MQEKQTVTNNGQAVTERYAHIFTEERNSDVVKNYDTPFYLIFNKMQKIADSIKEEIKEK